MFSATISSKHNHHSTWLLTTRYKSPQLSIFATAIHFHRH